MNNKEYFFQRDNLIKYFVMEFYLYYLQHKHDEFEFFKDMTYLVQYPSEEFFDMFFYY